MAKEKYTEKQLEKMSVEELSSLLGETKYTKKRLEKMSVEELRDIDSKTKTNYFDGSDESRNRDCTDGDFSGNIYFGYNTNGFSEWLTCDRVGNYPRVKFYENRLGDGQTCRNNECVNPCDTRQSEETIAAGWFYDTTFCNTLENQNLVDDCDCREIGPDDPRAWFCPNCTDGGEFKSCTEDSDCWPVEENCAVYYLGTDSGRTIYDENKTLYYDCGDGTTYQDDILQYECIEGVYGCTDESACNHNPCANIQITGYCADKESGEVLSNWYPNKYECCGEDIFSYCINLVTGENQPEITTQLECCRDEGQDCGSDGPNNWVTIGEECGPDGEHTWVTTLGCYYVGMNVNEVENYWYDETFYTTTDYGLPCTCDPTNYFICPDDTSREGQLECSEQSIAGCDGIWDSCDYRASRQFGELEKELEFVNPSECDWDLGDEMPQWYCRFMAGVGYGFWDMFVNQPAFDESVSGENHTEFLDGLPDCVVGAEKIRLDNNSFDSTGETFTCGCNGISIDEPDIEGFGWINQEYENKYLTCNMCVRKPYGTTAYDDVYGKCFNGNPPSFAATKIRILQDDSFNPQYGYCCDENAVNFSGELACGVVPIIESINDSSSPEIRHWIPLPSLSDEKNIPAYYEFDNEGMIEILQRYHVDEGRETENTCPSNGEIPPHKSSTNPLGTKQCSCFCKYEDSMGNICYPYEMVMYEDEVEVCQPSLDLHNLEGTRPQNRVGEARHYLNNSFLPLTGNSEFPGGELDDYTIGRHYLPNFATAGYNYGSELPEISEGNCNIILDMEECETLPCTDNGPIIQQAINQFSGTLLPGDTDDFYTICILPGDYAIYTDIKINKSNIVLKGSENTRFYFGEIPEDIPGEFGEDLNLEKFNKVTECLFNTMAMQREDVNYALDSLLSYTGECSDYYEGFFSGQTDLGIRISGAYQSMCCEDGYGGDANCDNQDHEDFNPGHAWRNSCKRYWAKNNHIGFDAGDDVNAGYELWNCDSETIDCEIIDDLLIDTGIPMWYSECAQADMSCNTNLCDTIIGKAVYFGCFITSDPPLADGYEYSDDQERFEPSFWNMRNDFMDRCPDYSIQFENGDTPWEDWDEELCASNCIFSTEDYQGNAVCEGNYPYKWHIDPTLTTSWPDNICKYWTADMANGDSGPYPCGIQSNVTANRFGFYDIDGNSLTVEEMYSEFFIAGYCEPPEDLDLDSIEDGVGYGGGTCKVYCDNPLIGGCGETTSEIVNERQENDEIYYNTVAKYMIGVDGEYSPMIEKPCNYWKSGYGDFECGYEKTPQDFCQGSCGRKTAKIQIGSIFEEQLDERKLPLTESGLKNSNYIYVEYSIGDGDYDNLNSAFLRNGDKINIYMEMSDEFRQEHNMTSEQNGTGEDYWIGPELSDGRDIKMFTRTVVDTPKILDNNILRLTLDVPLRYKVPIYDGVTYPYVRKITNLRINNIGLEDIDISNALDYESALFWSPNQNVVKVNRVENVWIRNVNSFTDLNLAKLVHSNSDIDLIGDTTNTNPSNEYITKLLCIGGTWPSLADIDYEDDDELAEWFANRCSDGNFEPAKYVFDEIMAGLNSPNPSNVTNESRHLLSNGILILDANNVTIKNCTLKNPQNRGKNGNGHLFNIKSGNEILVEDCEGYRGRHNFLLGGNLGNSGIVLNRIISEGGWAFNFIDDDWWSRYQQLEVPGLGAPGLSGTYLPLNMSFLVTDSDIKDGFSTKNRQDTNQGVGITGTDGVFWNIKNNSVIPDGQQAWESISVPGIGVLESFQWGTGYLNQISDDILLLTDREKPYDYRKHLTQQTVEMITGENLWPSDDKAKMTLQLLVPVIDKFIEKGMEDAISFFAAEKFESMEPIIQQNPITVEIPFLPDIQCLFNMQLRDFKCPQYDSDEEPNCDNVIRGDGVSVNTEYDLTTNRFMIEMEIDWLQIGMSFYLCSELDASNFFCSFANNDIPCGFDNARLNIHNIEISATVDLDTGEIVGQPILNFTENDIDFDVDGYGEQTWFNTKIDSAVYDGIKDAICQDEDDCVMGDVIAPLLGSGLIEPLKKFLEEQAGSLGDNAGSGTGVNDKVYGLGGIGGYSTNQIDYLGSGGEPSTGRWGGNNLYEYQQEYGSVFSSNDYNRSLENDTELDDSESYYPKDGVYQSPSKEHLDWKWFTSPAAFGCTDPMAWPNYDYFATIDDGSCKYYGDFYGTGDLNGSGTAGNPHLTLDDLELMVDYVNCINNVDERTNPEDCIGTLDTELPLEEFIKIGDMNGDNDINIDDIELLSDIIDTQAGDFTDELDRLAHLINWLLDNLTVIQGGTEYTACQILGLLTGGGLSGPGEFGSLDPEQTCLGGYGVDSTCENLKLFLSDGFTELFYVENFIDIPCSHRIGSLIGWAGSVKCAQDQNPYCDMEENTCTGGSNAGLCCPYDFMGAEGCTDYYSSTNPDGHTCGDYECGFGGDQPCDNPGNIYWLSECSESYDCSYDGSVTDNFNGCTDTNQNGDLLSSNFEISHYTTLETWLAIRDNLKDSNGNGYCDYETLRCEKIDNEDDYCNTRLDQTWCFVEEEYCGDFEACNYGADENCTYSEDFSNLCFEDLDGDGDYERGIILNFCPEGSSSNESTCEQQGDYRSEGNQGFILGCTDINACNYNPFATEDNSECDYQNNGYNDIDTDGYLYGKNCKDMNVLNDFITLNPTYLDSNIDRVDLTFSVMIEEGFAVFNDRGHLIELLIKQKGLQGSLPESIGYASFLEVIDLHTNGTNWDGSFGGPIPESIGDLKRLRIFDGGGNGWSGTLQNVFRPFSDLSDDESTRPSRLHPSRLEYLDLQGNLGSGGDRLEGNIPDEIGQLPNLVNFKIQRNNLSGEIPRNLFNLMNVEGFNLGDNLFEGTISDNICNMLANRDNSLGTNEFDNSFGIYRNSLCPPYPECIEEEGFIVGEQTTDNCGRGVSGYDKTSTELVNKTIKNVNNILKDKRNKNRVKAAKVMLKTLKKNLSKS